MQNLQPSKIIILDEKTASQIAAGEVIERPASVVKELVENSLDAGAKNITIEVADGGKTLLSISDDGCGMNKEEVQLAPLRFSTSKINSLDNLSILNTFGFRGEALHSIAAVSQMEIFTKAAFSSEPGTYLKISSSNIEEVKEIGISAGTTIKIKNLFYNTPARLKFLKGNFQEFNCISECVDYFALSHPEVSFKFIHNGAVILKTEGSNSLKESIETIFGKDFLDNLLPLDFSHDFLKVKAFLSNPAFTRPRRDRQFFFVNRRGIKNYLLSRVLSDVYVSTIPSQRYPAAIVFLEIDPRLIDVNVHPTKREIRFVPEVKIYEILKNGFKRIFFQRGQKLDHKISAFEQNTSFNQISFPLTSQIKFPEILINGKSEEEEKVCWQSLTNLEILGQLNLTYILLKEKENLFIIDQHTACERIIFDQLKENNFSDFPSQMLLSPVMLEFSYRESAFLKNNQEIFLELGFTLEEFGHHSFLLRSIPQLTIGKIDAQNIFKDIISELISDQGKNLSLERLKEKTLKIIACRGAIKAGQFLTAEQMKLLLDLLLKTSQPFTCPHGRPIVVKLSLQEINRLFGR